MLPNSSPSGLGTTAPTDPPHAAPQMPQPRGRGHGEGLSLQTLVVAAVASGLAAILTSHFWKSGTVVAAAMTPVIVSIVKEALQRPMQSDLVRRSAEAARRRRTEVSARRPGTRPTETAATAEGVVLAHPRRSYGRGTGRLGRSGLRGVHLRLAIATGLIAFVVAAVALTVPELLFGGAVASQHSTTLFGGGGSSKSQSKPGKSDTGGSRGGAAPRSQTPSHTSTQPQGTSTQPQGTTSQPRTQTQTQTQPQTQSQPQQAPGGGSSAPRSPVPSLPKP